MSFLRTVSSIHVIFITMKTIFPYCSIIQFCKGVWCISIEFIFSISSLRITFISNHFRVINSFDRSDPYPGGWSIRHNSKNFLLPSKHDVHCEHLVKVKISPLSKELALFYLFKFCGECFLIKVFIKSLEVWNYFMLKQAISTNINSSFALAPNWTKFKIRSKICKYLNAKFSVSQIERFSQVICFI